jgi:hypothetical protein
VVLTGLTRYSNLTPTKGQPGGFLSDAYFEPLGPEATEVIAPAGHNSRVVSVTTDGGRTWGVAAWIRGPAIPKGCYDSRRVEISLSTLRRAWAECGSEPPNVYHQATYVLRSVDGGEHWAVLGANPEPFGVGRKIGNVPNFGNLGGLVPAPDGRHVFMIRAGDNEAILRSVDGRRWRTLLGDDGSGLGYEIQFLDARNAWARSSQVLYWSHDAGIHWTVVARRDKRFPITPPQAWTLPETRYPLCPMAAFRVTRQSGGAATGHVLRIFRLKNISGRTCAMRGWPTVHVLGRARKRIPVQTCYFCRAFIVRPNRPTLIVIKPGESSFFGIELRDSGWSARAGSRSSAIQVQAPRTRDWALIPFPATFGPVDPTLLVGPIRANRRSVRVR